MAQAGIYRIVVRRPEGSMFYIGQAVDLSGRWKQHLRALRAGRHDNIRLQRSFAKYGEATFSFKPILICSPDKELLTIYEQSIVDFYFATIGDRVVLNVMRQCVSSHLGVKRRPETLEKMSVALRGKKRTPEQNAENAARRKGIPLSEATRAKVSVALKSIPRHPNSMAALQENRNLPTRLEALRAALCGRPKIHSEETKKKIAKTLTGRKQSVDLIERRVAGLRGRKQSPEAIAKRVASRLANAAKASF